MLHYTNNSNPGQSKKQTLLIAKHICIIGYFGRLSNIAVLSAWLCNRTHRLLLPKSILMPHLSRPFSAFLYLFIHSMCSAYSVPGTGPGTLSRKHSSGRGQERWWRWWMETQLLAIIRRWYEQCKPKQSRGGGWRALARAQERLHMLFKRVPHWGSAIAAKGWGVIQGAVGWRGQGYKKGAGMGATQPPPWQEGSRERPCHVGPGGFCMTWLYPEVHTGEKLQASGQRDAHHLPFVPDSSVTNVKDLQNRGL